MFDQRRRPQGLRPGQGRRLERVWCPTEILSRAGHSSPVSKETPPVFLRPVSRTGCRGRDRTVSHGTWSVVPRVPVSNRSLPTPSLTPCLPNTVTRSE